ncbi:MAG TPA: YggS family pyridoxal phosphate-dependent enzyme [Candidatus Binatia bacterium]|nr:YggS family pyridoxal phosphate-dependent enzyme [Candidatus Binatia bacterium]
MIDIADNIARVRERIARAAERSGRSADEIRLIAVSKTKPAALIAAAVRAGVADLGENYVQEAAGKIAQVNDPAVHWHLIGHLQRNKAARAVELFAVIHTVDSLALADALDRHAAARGRRVRVLVEVNVGSEASKGGVRPEQTGELLAALAERKYLRVEGLMTVPPAGDDPHSARSFFAHLRLLRDQFRATITGLTELSMGMTDDFEVAIEEGATMVRIGRGIFGAREL